MARNAFAAAVTAGVGVAEVAGADAPEPDEHAVAARRTVATPAAVTARVARLGFDTDILQERSTELVRVR